MMRGWLRQYGKRLFIWGCVAAVACVLCTVIYGKWEAQQLECNAFALPEHVLPGCSGLKIGHLSDVHGDGYLLMKAVDMMIREEPDLVVITGDFFMATERTNRVSVIVKQLQRLSKRFPTFACLGNHDLEKLATVERVLDHGGVELLRNERLVWHCPRLNRDLVIAGVGDWLEYDFFPHLCLQTKEEAGDSSLPVMLLCHNPACRHELNGYVWGLMLSGHTHGNQARFPFTRTPIIRRERESHTEGYLEWGGSGVFVTRGIGSILGMRFFCPPEVNVLTIQ